MIWWQWVLILFVLLIVIIFIVRIINGRKNYSVSYSQDQGGLSSKMKNYVRGCCNKVKGAVGI